MTKTIKKNIKEILLYLIFGILTTIVSLGTYLLLTRIASVGYYVANILSWVVAVSFAFITNKNVVYKDNGQTLVKAVRFFVSRAATLGMETILLYYGIEKLGFNDFATKLFIQVLVVVGNYVAGKVLVFRNHNRSSETSKMGPSIKKRRRR